MTLVRMLKQISGTRNGQEWPAPGGTIEVSEEEAGSLLFSNQAVKVEKSAKVEAPPAPPPVSEVVVEEAPEATRQATEEAEERGVDLSDVEGTGAEGKITKGDVTAHADAADAAEEEAKAAAKKGPGRPKGK